MATIEASESVQQEIARLKRQLDQMAAQNLRADQKLAELESSLKKYEAVAQNAGEAIWVVIDGKIIFTNRLAQKVLNRTKSELRSLPVTALVQPEDADILSRQLFPPSGAENQTITRTVRIIDREGSLHWFQIRSVSTVWDGKPAYLGFLSDTTQLKLEEDSLREREQFYAALIEYVPDGIAIIQDSRLVYVNQRLADMAGYAIEKAIGEPFWKFIYPEDRELVIDNYLHRMAGDERPDLYEAGILAQDGRRIAVEISARVIDFNGEPADFVYIHDISYRKATEALTQQSEAELRALVQNLIDFILVIDEDTYIKFETPSASHVLGYPAGYLVGKKGIELIHPDDIEQVREDLTDVIAGKGNLDPTEFRIKDSSGKWLSFEVVAENRLDDPVLQGIVITGRETTAQKQAAEEMRSLRNFNERILHSMLEGILVQDRDGVYTYANPSAGIILGYAPEELVGKSWRDITPEESYSIVASAIQRREKGESDSYEVEMLRKDGSRVICWVSGNPLFDTDGYAGAVAVYADISNFKEAERRNQQLLEQQIYVNRLALTLGNLTDLNEIYRTTCEMVQALLPVDVFIFNSFNPHERSMNVDFLRAFDEDMNVGDFPKIPFGDEQHQMIRRVIESQQAEYNHDFNLTRDSLDRIDALSELISPEHQRLLKLMMLNSRSVLAIPMKVGGATTGILIVQCREKDMYTPEDIDLLTALANIAAIAVQNARLLDQARQQSEEIQQIINTVPQGVLLLDANYTTLLANPAAQGYLKSLAGESVGERLTHLAQRSLDELLEPPDTGSWHEITSGKQSFQLVARPIEHGPVRGGWVLVIRDITQEREVERRIQLQDRLATVGQLAAGMAHDFNNIMSTIVLYAQMSAQSPWISIRDRERISTIYQQALQATELIRQILDFSRRSILERQPLSLRPLLKEQVRLFERTLGEDIRVELTGMVSRGMVYGDPTRLQQVMLNLAINARDAMPNGGILRIGLDELVIQPGSKPPLPELHPGKWVRLSVSDSGTGINPEDLPHIFEPFYTTKGPGEGTGLGLAQVYGIVSQHEGYIDVNSQPGAGASFTIYLPGLGEDVSGPRDIDTGPLSRGRDQTILVVEDNEYVRQALVDSLEMLNYRVIAAANGREALEVLTGQQNVINLVMSDVIMPEMSGISLVNEMSDRGMGIPVVLLSGYGTDKGLESLSATGNVQILSKPPNLDQLSEIVNRMVKKDKR